MNRQDGYHLLPPGNLPYLDLQQACNTLFQNAENVFYCIDIIIRQRIKTNGEMLLQERVIVRTVPVVKAVGQYKSKQFDFWVYGTEEKCHAPTYPMTCCCGCATF